MHSLIPCAAIVLCGAFVAHAGTVPAYGKLTLSTTFYGEGAAIGDLSGDGIPDLVSGPYWYEGPDYAKHRHELYAPKAFDANNYSDNFFAFVRDIDKDGRNDVLVIGFPGTEAAWYKNPGAAGGAWKRTVAAPIVDDESPDLVDLRADGSAVLLHAAGGYLGWSAPDPADPTKPWAFHRISSKGHWQRFTHGLGAGDVNGDGRPDVLEKGGWWEQPVSLAGDPVWAFHAYAFSPDAASAEGGGAQMYAYDVDGDGDNDVIAALQAHQWGLAWFENAPAAGGIGFTKRMIMGTRAEEAAYGAAFSQPHSLALADMDGDGLKDLVCGKRWWAHGPSGDPEPNAAAVLYGFRLVREAGKPARYVPWRIDDNSGSGTQLTVGDANGDGRPDILIGNKKGTFFFASQGPAPLLGRDRIPAAFGPSWRGWNDALGRWLPSAAGRPFRSVR